MPNRRCVVMDRSCLKSCARRLAIFNALSCAKTSPHNKDRAPHLPPAGQQCEAAATSTIPDRGCVRMTDRNAEPLLPVELGAGKVKFAQGMKAGRWVFATGLMAQDFVHGIAPDVLADRIPHADRPKREKETLRIYENLDAVLRA